MEKKRKKNAALKILFWKSYSIKLVLEIILYVSKILFQNFCFPNFTPKALKSFQNI